MSKSIEYERLREINPESDEELLGSGFAFPLRVTTSGGTKVAKGEDSVKSSIFHIATYNRGDLYGTPSFGSNLPKMLSTVFSGDKLALHEEWLKQGIENWEPRIADLRVTAGKDVNDTTNSKVVILAQYRVVSTSVEQYTLLPVGKE